MTAEKFKEAIIERFDSLYEFVEAQFGDYDYGKKLPGFLEGLGITFHSELDRIEYDSYGSEDSKLRKIFFHEESGKYFELYGTRCSYQGEEYDGIKEVKLIEKIITIFE